MAKHFVQNHVRWPPKVATKVLQACVQFGEAEGTFVSNMETAMATLLNVTKKQLSTRSTREILRAFQCVMGIWVAVCGDQASDSKLGEDGVRVNIPDPFAAVEVIVGIWEASDPDFKSFSQFYHGADDSAISPLRMVVFPALYRWVLRLDKTQLPDKQPIGMAHQSYLGQLLTPESVNTSEAVAFLEASRHSFDSAYGPKCMEGWVRIVNSRRAECCTNWCGWTGLTRQPQVWAVLKPGFLAFFKT